MALCGPAFHAGGAMRDSLPFRWSRAVQPTLWRYTGQSTLPVALCGPVYLTGAVAPCEYGPVSSGRQSQTLYVVRASAVATPPGVSWLALPCRWTASQASADFAIGFHKKIRRTLVLTQLARIKLSICYVVSCNFPMTIESMLKQTLCGFL